MLANTTESPGTDTLVMFILLVILVLFRARSQSATSRRGRSRRGRAPARAELLKHPLARAVRYAGIGAPPRRRARCSRSSTTLPSRLIDYSTVLVFLMVAVSATVLTGWAGQLSLGQFAFVAIGAYLTAYYGQSAGLPARRSRWARSGVSAIAIVIGIPALRVRGLYLAIITLGFALVVSGYLHPAQTGSTPPSPASARASHPPDDRSVGLRDRQGRVLLLLLRRRCWS